MIGLNRRNLFKAFLAAPLAAVVARLPEPVKELVRPSWCIITREAVKMFVNSDAFIKNINRQFDDEFSQYPTKVGSQLRIRLPNDYAGRPGA
jgi:hypothetical protein